MGEGKKVFDTPVLVIDSLGLSNELKSTDGDGLLRIVEKLDRHYHEFRAKMPHRARGWLEIVGDAARGSPAFKAVVDAALQLTEAKCTKRKERGKPRGRC